MANTNTNTNTMTIIDFDDTLFPTSFIMNKNIDLTKPQSNHHGFKHLDKLLHTLLTNMLNYTKIVIITNATRNWVFQALKTTPQTNYLIKHHIKVISARELYQSKYSKIGKWKMKTFLNINKEKYSNIISIGDAEYELKALINLYDGKKTLKSIKYIKSPTYNQIIDQLSVTNNSLKTIYNTSRNLDLVFTPQ